MHQTENSTRAEAPTDTLRLVPVSLISDTMNVMARAYERIHSMPRVSDTELAIKVGEAKERLRPFLVPTAPVEASGSEREHGPKCWGKTSASDEMAHCYCGSTDLRPQPSGETREAVRLALEDADALDRVSEEADDNQWQDWAATMRQAASRIRRLALLSTSPLALGGQQGDSETLRVLLDNLVIAQTLSKDIRQKATDEARSYLYGRRHTTARAEALDEGAAGKREQAIKELIAGYAVMHEVICFMAGTSGAAGRWYYEKANAAFEKVKPLHVFGNDLATHPSPTPAADADRVRIAVEAIRAERHRQVEVEGWSEGHDDYQMARAAGCYALNAGRHDTDEDFFDSVSNAAINHSWPWDWSWWKPKDRRSDLVRAGALIVAEIERLDRAALKSTAAKGSK